MQVNVQRGHGEAEESVANVTDIHEPLHFAGGQAPLQWQGLQKEEEVWVTGLAR